MAALFWAALGFFLLATLAGGGFVGLRGWQAWSAFVSVAATAGAGLDRLLSGAEQLATRGEQAAAQADELVNAVERLRRSLARGRILLGAAGEALDLLRAVRGFVPQK
jgi:hypothetical protein